MDIPDEAFASQDVRRSRLVKEWSNWEKYVSHPSRWPGPEQLTADRLERSWVEHPHQIRMIDCERKEAVALGDMFSAMLSG